MTGSSEGPREALNDASCVVRNPCGGVVMVHNCVVTKKSKDDLSVLLLS
jgi:hypothetical protein